jgi:hypothetical protein
MFNSHAGTFILPPKKLTVILRNDAPMLFCNDTPTYRSISIELTEEQRRAIRVCFAYNEGESVFYENISKCFIED